MGVRKKADGTAFEKEFSNEMKDLYYIRRLPTLRTGYAGQTQPADFILIGDNFNYIELKETARNSFSISSLQQYAEIEDFLEYRKRLEGMLKCKMNYWLIVRFLGKSICAISNEEIMEFKEAKRTLKYNSPEAIRVDEIKDLKKEKLF